MHHIVAVQEGHSGQDLLGQPDHVLLCKGLIVICNTLVEDLATGGTAKTEEEGKLRKTKKMRANDLYLDGHPVEF